MIKLCSKLSAFSFGLLVCLILYALLEVFFGYLLRQRAGTHDQSILEYSHERYYEIEPRLGYRPFANTSIRSSLTKSGRTCYDITYETDQYHRRITPVADPEQRDQYALFFGGSYAYGEGVAEDETLPSHFARLAPQYRPYNYAFHGYGPQNMLAKLQGVDIREEVPEAEGICVYVYLPDYHEKRAVGSMQVFTGWGNALPYYRLDQTDRVVRNDDFERGRPFVSSLYSLINTSNIVTYFKLDVPIVMRKSHYYVTARILNEAKKEFQKKFQSDNFYVLIYPHDLKKAKIIDYLEELGIKYFSYDLFKPFQEGYYIKGDCHPNSHAFETIAHKLARDIQSVKENI